MNSLMSKILKNFNMDNCLHILVILLAGFSVTLGETRTTNMIEDIHQRDRILFNGSLAAIKTRSKISCANQCSMTDRCLSMFYKFDSKQCVFHDFSGGYLKLHPSITNPSSGWKYYEQVEGPGVFARSERCLSNGFEYDPTVDICYIIKTMDVDFNLIKQQCVDLNSELIKITSQEKQDWITSKLTTVTQDLFCIQGNNDNNMDEYRFDDGTSMTHFYWNTDGNQPDGGNDHFIFLKRSVNYKWHDVPRVHSGNQCVIVCEM